MATIASSGAGGGLTSPSIFGAPQATTSNYTDLVSYGQNKQLPDSYAKLVNRFGNQSIQGFLAKTASEYPLLSDTVTWAEEGRLNLFYENLTWTSGNSRITWTNGATGSENHAIRVGNVVLITDGTLQFVGYVSAVAYAGTADAYIVVEAYNATEFTSLSTTAEAISVRVIGSEFAKGTASMAGSIESVTQNYSNNPIILKDKYSVSGSDTAQIGWIQTPETTAQEGGYLWFLKSELDTRERFMDTLETMMLEAIPANETTDAGEVDGINGTDGIFYAIEERGITVTGGFASGTWDAATADYDAIVQELDRQGSIQENLLWLNRTQSLNIDDGLSRANNQGLTAGADAGSTDTQHAGASWGSYANEKDMYLNLGFKGFSRGSYSFYKTDWKYLNDITGRANFLDCDGILAPMGSKSVYDSGMGSKVARPYIHVRYRASSVDNRKLKNWVTGSVGGVMNDEHDRMDVHYLSERCTVVQAANNFMKFE